MTAAEMLDRSTTLGDGRNVSYAEFGDFQGFPVIHQHGHGNCRLEGEMFSRVARKLGIRLIVPDRPGYGNSTFTRRSLLGWARDIKELTETLDVDEFSLLGISGGAPHVLACAHEIGDLVYQYGVISTVGPPGLGTKTMDRSLRTRLFLASRLPWIYGMGLKKQMSLTKDPEEFLSQINKNRHRMPVADFELFNDDRFFDFYIRISKEGFSHGINAALHDARAFAGRWGFDISDITCGERITFWHGDKDPAFGVVKLMNEMIRNSHLRVFPGEGHVSLAVNHADQILASLIPK